MSTASYDPKRYRVLQRISNLKDANSGEYNYDFAADEVVIAGDPGVDEALAEYPSMFEEVLLPVKEAS